ncbi:MAG: hypothetical protein M0C28_25725 [Candidatus Moduliflexus flocculans]|nr:hypothetical protein [Candidatus Moduliflexus flocculans]
MLSGPSAWTRASAWTAAVPGSGGRPLDHRGGRQGGGLGPPARRLPGLRKDGERADPPLPPFRKLPVIVLAFLFSQGIAKSGLAPEAPPARPGPLGRHPGRLLAAMILSSFVFVFLIPPAFFPGHHPVRDLLGVPRRPRAFRTVSGSVCCFALHLFSALANNLFLQGDLVLNPAFLGFAGLSRGRRAWGGRLFAPTLAHMALVLAAFLVFARKDLRVQAGPVGAAGIAAHLSRPGAGPAQHPPDRRCPGGLGAGGSPRHPGRLDRRRGHGGHVRGGPAGAEGPPGGESGAPSVPHRGLLIGTVLADSGTADRVFPRLAVLLPRAWSPGLALGVVGVSMAGHMLLGSNMTSLSVLVPAFRAVGEGVGGAGGRGRSWSFVSVTTQFLLALPPRGDSPGRGGGALRAGDRVPFRPRPDALISAAAAAFLYPAWWGIRGLP